jgi:hypothetical protein
MLGDPYVEIEAKSAQESARHVFPIGDASPGKTVWDWLLSIFECWKLEHGQLGGAYGLLQIPGPTDWTKPPWYYAPPILLSPLGLFWKLKFEQYPHVMQGDKILKEFDLYAVAAIVLHAPDMGSGDYQRGREYIKDAMHHRDRKLDHEQFDEMTKTMMPLVERGHKLNPSKAAQAKAKKMRDKTDANIESALAKERLAGTPERAINKRIAGDLEMTPQNVGKARKRIENKK